MIFLLFACLVHKTTLTGIVDYTTMKNCAIVLDTNETIIINSNICLHMKEGDVVYFYARSK